MLPDFYVILVGDEATLFQQVKHCLLAGQRFFYFRDPAFELSRVEFLKKLLSEIHALDGKLCVSTEALFLATGADGLHLKSHQLMQLQTRPAGVGLLAASCHNEAELNQAEKWQCDFVVLSPVKCTRTHPDSAPLGWAQFQNWVLGRGMPIYALGGLQQADLVTAKEHGAQGIAGVGAFKRQILHQCFWQ